MEIAKNDPGYQGLIGQIADTDEKGISCSNLICVQPMCLNFPISEKSSHFLSWLRDAALSKYNGRPERKIPMIYAELPHKSYQTNWEGFRKTK